MKIPFTFFKNSHMPKASSLRPPLFNVTRHWFLSLGVSLIILVVTGVVGFNLFYYGYSEAYKLEVSNEPQDPLGADRLESVVEKRNAFITASTTIPKDPSI